MLNIIIKYFFIFICSFYLYHKLLNLSTSSFSYKIVSPITSILLTAFICIIRVCIPYPVNFLIAIFCFYILISLFTKTDFTPSLTGTIISFAMNFSFYIFCSSIVSFILFLLYKPDDTIPVTISVLLIGILQYILVHIPFKFKRLKKGMPFLYQRTANTIGIFISILILICYIIASITDIVNNYYLPFAIAILFIFTCALLLASWWRTAITKNYQKKLQELELQTLKDELEKTKSDVIKLKENNDSLARIIHKDNKLIPAMELAVNTFLNHHNNLSSDELAEQGLALLKHLQVLSHDRQHILTEYQMNEQPLPTTGICAVDAVLSFMQQKAAQKHIHYEVSICSNVREMIAQAIPEKELSHLLADLIENSFIAVTDSPVKNVLIKLGQLNNNFMIEVADSGVPFKPETFQNLGLKQHTTHSNNGGSGIGLMDIWKLKQEYRASLVIHEYDSKKYSYSKHISIIFDKKKHYLIKTYRPKEIQCIQTRSDLCVFSHY